MNTVVWIMIVVGANVNNWNVGGPEFTSKEKCEVAAQVIQKTVDDIRWGMNIRRPICVRIEK